MTREEMLNECVSRDKAIVQLNHLKSDWDDEWNVPIRKCIETIKKLPPVTPQPNMGRWKRINKEKYVQHAMSYYRCSECGKEIIGTHNYCPNCGAKMSEIPTGQIVANGELYPGEFDDPLTEEGSEE